MPDISLLSQIPDWIESHGKTVDLLKWALLLLLAWAVGAFKYLRQKLRQPIPLLEEVTSRCLVEEFDEFNGHRNAVRASFLLEVGLVNTTSESIVIRQFSLSVRRRKFWRSWKPGLSALSLPARPRHQTGASTKLLKNWFSNFQDEFPDLTLDGTVEPKHYNSGFLLFVCFATGDHVPRISDDYINVKAHVHLTTGETRTVQGKVRVLRDKEKFDQWVPGFVAQVSHDSAWGAIRGA